ncbi:hypothetical protein OEA41_008770 [Lepraria neglecta]|uniref:Spindle pole body-associated protein cut12 domain-containing protein n=1 Tax=Lepraria neglecta TaxID=209136 RepID=A0AAD9Z3P3_9LECA|nr:hypothetical protein OEA41_008770 [Lepraria neglecta]
MLDWFTGSSRPGDAQYAQAEDGQSYIEEPPETPAPLFAVRAFKTAIFGTPHPVERDHNRLAHALEKAQAITDQARSEQLEDTKAMDKDNTPTKAPVLRPKLDPFSSPAKGILLTPGTTAARRKTVSFLHLEESVPEKAAEPPVEDVDSQIDPALTPPKKESEAPSKEQPRQSKLTKTLIELSKQRSENKTNPVESDTRATKSAKTPTHAFETDSIQETPDVTVDLDQPRSRSGQHWKTEYEQYHRRSSREIKQILRYGQNVKSYAVKKDSEATSLAEKLEKELARVARMEKKVTKLAAQLNAAQSQGPEGETEQQRLVGELAQQTALAIRYKQKADQYKVAIQEQNPGEGQASDKDVPQAESNEDERSHGLLSRPDPVDVSSNTFYLQAQLDDLRRTSKAAEDHAKQLERENKALKRNLLRVKEEMTSYETRRQAREENLKKREEQHKAARKECEKRLAQLTTEHQKLLRASDRASTADDVVEIQALEVNSSARRLRENRKRPKATIDEDTAKDSQSAAQVSKPYMSPRKRKPQNTAADIWTLSSPNDAAMGQDLFPETTQLPPSSVRYDIRRTLKEIDQNLGTEKQADIKSNHSPINLKADSPLKALAMETRERMENHKSAISSPRPKMINFSSSPAKLQPSGPTNLAYAKPSRATVARSASLMSNIVGSRTSTMGSVRGSALPADRAAAAKARLAKRSAEKKRQASA